MKKIIASFLFVCFFALASFAQESVRVQCPPLVGVGEQFNVTVSVEASDTPSDPEWNIGEDFQLVWGPQRIGTSTSISIINGKKTSSHQVTYNYILLPRKKGSFTLPPVTVKIDGSTVSSSPVHIEVATDGASTQGAQGSGQSSARPAADVRAGGVENFLRFNISKNDVVVGEPITATLKLYTRASIAGFEDVKLPTFNGFWSQETFAPDNIQFRREELNDKIYNTAVLRQYTLIPQQTGNVVIEPAEITLVANVQTAPSGIGSIFDSFFEEVQQVRKKAVSAGYTVRVKALPDGAPDSFNGGVGSFTITASLASDTLKTHDASSLIVTVSGRGNIALVEAPKVDFPSDFEAYDVKTSDKIDADKTSGSKIFEYPFIPRSYGKFEIPAIRFSFYNPVSGKYETVSSGPLTLNVKKSKAGDVKGDGSIMNLYAGKDVKDLDTDIRYIATRTPEFRQRGTFFAFSASFFVLLAIIVLAGLALYLYMRKAAASRADVAGVRNKAATKMARKRLSRAGEFLEKNLYSAFYEELHRALLGFSSDKLTIDAADLSKENITAGFVSKGVDEGLASDFAALLDACEYARYSPDQSHEAMDAHYTKAVELISSIDSAMKHSKKSPVHLAILAFLLLMPFTSFAQDADSLWVNGVEAYDSGDWKAAIEAFGEIESSGNESALLYYNLGNAHYKNGDLGKAVLYYKRSLKLQPADADAIHNLEFTRAQLQDRIDKVPDFFLKSWFKALRGSLSADAWAVLCLVFAALLVAMALLFLLSARTAARKTGFFAGIAALLLTIVCLCCSALQKSSYSSSNEAVVVSALAEVKSSPSKEGSRNLFVLHEGTEVEVLDSVGDWTNVKLSDGRQGWLSSETIEKVF